VEHIPPPVKDPLEELLEQIHAEQENLRASLAPLVKNHGHKRFTNTTRNKLISVIEDLEEDKVRSLDLYEDLKLHIASQDAYDLREASVGFGTDETKMANIVVARNRENIVLTDKVYIERYNRSLACQIKGENKTLMGMFGADSLSHFGRFLCLRVQDPAERDAYLLHKAMNGMGCSDYILVEILSTRTNFELKMAAHKYAESHDGESLAERIMTETGGFGKKWYGLWIDSLVQFERVEDAEIHGDPAELAQQLYDAGEGKWVGCDEQPFIDILSKANEPTCLAIADAYEALEDSKKTLEEAVEDKMGGDLEFAVCARVRSKFDFLAIRMFKACKGWGTDDECLARVLACLDKGRCSQLEEAYNARYAEEDEPFNDFKKLLESEISGSFLEALTNVLEATPPKGHALAETEYWPHAEVAANCFVEECQEGYNDETCEQLGKSDLYGRLRLCNVDESNVFLQEEYAYDLPCLAPFEPPEFKELLECPDPSEIDAAQALLSKLQAQIAETSSATQDIQDGHGSRKDDYMEKCRQLRLLDHYVRRILEDNANMLEFCASRDADNVHDATEGWGTDEDKLIRVLCSLQKRQLRRVDEIYAERYGQTLREVTEGELGGFFEGSFKYFMKCVLTKDAELDAELLLESMKGWGTDDGLLCEIICTRTAKELEAAAAVFAEQNGKPLTDWIDGDTSGRYQDFMLECLKTEHRGESWQSYTGYLAAGDDVEVAEMSVGDAKKRCKELRAAGFTIQGGPRSAEDEEVVTVWFKSSWRYCGNSDEWTSYRFAHGDADEEWAEQQAIALHEAGLGSPGVFAQLLHSSDVIIETLAHATPKQLRAIKSAYVAKYGQSLEDAVKAMASGDWERVLLAKVQDRSAFYAHGLEGSMKGWGTDENALSRILGRNEKPAIKKIGIAYEELYGRSLKEAIESETSGNFKKALLAMLFNESPGEMLDPGAAGDAEESPEEPPEE